MLIKLILPVFLIFIILLCGCTQDSESLSKEKIKGKNISAELLSDESPDKIILKEPGKLTIENKAIGNNEERLRNDIDAALNPNAVKNNTKNNWVKELEGRLQILKGGIGCYVPDTMEVGQFYEAILILGKEGSLVQLIDKVKSAVGGQIGDHKVQVEIIQIGGKMKATLKDPFSDTEDNFSISCEPSEEQEVDLHFDEHVKWLWNIKPKTPGIHRLTINLWIAVERNGGISERLLNVYNGNVSVLNYEENSIDNTIDGDLKKVTKESVTTLDNNALATTKEVELYKNPWLTIAPLMLILFLGAWLFYLKGKPVISASVFPLLSAGDYQLLDDFIIEDEIEEALSFLEKKTDQCSDGSKQLILALYSRLSRVEEQRDKNIISFSQHSIERSRVIDDLQDILKKWKKVS